MASRTLREKVSRADLAILESTFEDGQEDYAKLYGHMTVSQAKEIGKLARRVLLIHQMPQDYFERMTCSIIETPEVKSEGRSSYSPERPLARRR